MLANAKSEGLQLQPCWASVVQEEDFPFIIATSITIISFSCDLIMFAK